MDFILNPTDYHLTNGEVLGRDWDDEKCALGIKNPDFLFSETCCRQVDLINSFMIYIV